MRHTYEIQSSASFFDIFLLVFYKDHSKECPLTKLYMKLVS